MDMFLHVLLSKKKGWIVQTCDGTYMATVMMSLSVYCSYKLAEIWKTRPNTLICDLSIPKCNHNSLSAYSFLFFLSLSLRTVSPDEATEEEMYIVTVKKLLVTYN